MNEKTNQMEPSRRPPRDFRTEYRDSREQWSTLAGGFNCWLTERETDEWTRYAMGQPAYAELRQAEIDKAAAWAKLGDGVDGAEAEFRAAGARVNECADRLYHVGRAWHATIMAKRQAEQDRE